jgi:hypothetical protein
MRAAVKVAVVLLALGGPSVAQADSTPTFEERIAPASHWTIGVTLDRRISSRPFRGSGQSIEDQSLIGDQLFGVSATYVRRRFGVNSRILFLPQTLSPRTTIGLVLGPCVRFTAWGREIRYGANVQADAVFGEHHWILYASPAELGIDLYTNRSFHLQLVAGVRYALAGDIIRNVAIDPNGFPHEEFRMATDDKLEHPLEGTITAVFARRI